MKTAIEFYVNGRKHMTDYIDFCDYVKFVDFITPFVLEFQDHDFHCYPPIDKLELTPGLKWPTVIHCHFDTEPIVFTQDTYF